MTDDFPQTLTRDQLRFEIKFGLQQLGRAVVREWAGSNREKAERARDAVVETVLVRFDRMQVRTRAPARPIFQNRKTVIPLIMENNCLMVI